VGISVKKDLFGSGLAAIFHTESTEVYPFAL
jgi:hypothetical protein